MAGFKPWISGVGSDRSTYWATTTAQRTENLSVFLCCVATSRYEPYKKKQMPELKSGP